MKRLGAYVVLLVLAGLPARGEAQRLSTQQLKFHGTSTLGGPRAVTSKPEIGRAGVQRSHRGHSAIDVRPAMKNRLAATLASVRIPTPRGKAVVGPDPGFFGFAGLNHFDQRFAGTGVYTNTQFSVEPPDQGLCVGNGFVLEAVNEALAVYNTSGTLLSGPVALSQFYKLAPEFVRPNGPFGPFISDPKCYFDQDTLRWFVTELEIDINHSTGAFGTHASQLIAVSQTSDPTGSYNLFSFDTTDHGGKGCPCVGDQPLIGADANGFYVSTNEFPISGPGFNGPQLYAMSKTALAAGTLPTIVHINIGALPTPDGNGTVWYSVQPATSPNSSQYSQAQNGTEFFLSALQFGPAPFDNRIAVWALTNTGSLNSSAPNVSLKHVVITSEAYGLTGSFSAVQKTGSIPLGDLLGNAEVQLNGNDDRMNQVVFAGGNLWAGVNTSVSIASKSLLGIAFFVVKPSLNNGVLSASMSKQGYVAVAGENAIFPSIGADANANAAMTFTLVGPDYFPSAAYVPISSAAGNVRLAGPGAGPDDGFSGYPADGGSGVGRWGDYSAAVADGDGNIWIAVEYIGQTCTDVQYSADSTCGGTRSSNANWGTFIGRVPTPNQP